MNQMVRRLPARLALASSSPQFGIFAGEKRGWGGALVLLDGRPEVSPTP